MRLKRKSAVADKLKLLMVIKCLSLNKAKFDMMSEKFQKKIGLMLLMLNNCYSVLFAA